MTLKMQPPVKYKKYLWKLGKYYVVLKDNLIPIDCMNFTFYEIFTNK